MVGIAARQVDEPTSCDQPGQTRVVGVGPGQDGNGTAPTPMPS